MNFERIANGLNVEPLLNALADHPHLWQQITARQDYPGSAHHDTECIFVRGPAAFTPTEYQGTTDAHDYPAMDVLGDALIPLLRPVLADLGVTELGYVLIVKLKGFGVVDEHTDEGAYADHYSRFHLALTGADKAKLRVDMDLQHFAPGECWWFNHKRPHAALNGDMGDRIHVIFDAVTPRFPVHVPG